VHQVPSRHLDHAAVPDIDHRLRINMILAMLFCLFPLRDSDPEYDDY
jgi:hypothetical protein